jgi:predicted transcriptional regulator
MAKKTSIMDIEIGHEGFYLFRKFGLSTSSTEELDKLANLRSMLNSEKARILHTIKTDKPTSVYKLARLLGRDFQSVRKDILLLQKLGIVYLEKHSGKRKTNKPILVSDKLQVNISF